MFKEKLELLKKWWYGLLGIDLIVEDILPTEIDDPKEVKPLEAGDSIRDAAAVTYQDIEPIRADEIEPDEVILFEDLEIGDVFMFTESRFMGMVPDTTTLNLKITNDVFVGYDIDTTFSCKWLSHLAAKVIKIGELDD